MNKLKSSLKSFSFDLKQRFFFSELCEVIRYSLVVVVTLALISSCCGADHGDLERIDSNGGLSHLTKYFLSLIVEKTDSRVHETERLKYLEFLGFYDEFRDSENRQCICGETRVDRVIQLQIANRQLWIVRRHAVPQNLKMEPLYAVFVIGEDERISWMPLDGVYRIDECKQRMLTVESEQLILCCKVGEMSLQNEIVFEPSDLALALYTIRDGLPIRLGRGDSIGKNVTLQPSEVDLD
jgi:hypothetical protein